jgi:hypothetical protein
MIRPDILKGGFVHFASGSAQGRVLPFQYNPETIQRIVGSREGSAQPVETITFTLAIDAADALNSGDPTATSLGVFPVLSALEVLVTPRVTGGPFSSNAFTVLVLGANRILPVRVVELQVHEQMFDVKLNPIRAIVDVTMETLSDAELQQNSRAKDFMNAYRNKKITLAQQAGFDGSVEDLLRMQNP